MQDYAFASSGKSYALAIVSDGHGNNDYFRSDKGSTFASRSAQESIRKFMKNISDSDWADDKMQEKLLRQLETNIIYTWRKKVCKDHKKHPFTEEEKALMSEKAKNRYESDPKKFCFKAYGATLIAVVVCPKKFWLGLHIGDGKCVAQYADGQFEQPIPWDDKCFLNVTTSLCDEQPLKNIRHCFHTDNFPTAIFVGTDGVDDCFANDDDLYGFYEEVIQTFREKDFDKARAEIDSFLPTMSEKGSGDDISISGIIL